MPGLPAAMKYDVLIVGGGAAGLMCAIQAGRRGRKVAVLEHQDRFGKKILISGGGRCNFTNLHSGPENFLSENPNFCKSALARFKPADFVAWIEKHGIDYFEKTLGQLFCKVSAKQITEMLRAEAEASGVQMLTSCRVDQIARSEAGFELATSRGALTSSALVVATGGLSYAKLGASDFGYRAARQFGLRILEPRAGLVPLLWNGDDAALYAPLSGVSFPAVVSCRGKSFREAVLFTHKGLSGPATLQISSYWNPGDEVKIDLLPDFDAIAWLSERRLRNDRTHLKNLLASLLPKRLAETWCEANFPSRPAGDLSESQIRAFSEKLHHWKIYPAGTEGYDTAEVTLGGVDTRELSSKTFECAKVPGLYFIGEVVDVTGHLGGHNFQWAWASGYAAGQAV